VFAGQTEILKSGRQPILKSGNMMRPAPIVKLTGARARVKKGEAEITLPVKPKFFHARGLARFSLFPGAG